MSGTLLLAMKKRLTFWFITAGLLGGMATAGVHGWREWLHLQTEVASMRARVANAALLRAENERLRQNQVSAEELARLRADHAALPRLRAELQALTSKVRAGESAAPN